MNLLDSAAAANLSLNDVWTIRDILQVSVLHIVLMEKINGYWLW
jgi:hypothetical protein